MAKIFPILLALMGLGAGVGAGIALRPAPVEMAAAENQPCGSVGQQGGDGAHDALAEVSPAVAKEPDYVKMNNQFVIPVVEDGAVTALVVISLSLEMTSGGPELVFRREPKLRDSFLQVLFDHANTGGFEGNFTTGRKMDLLRSALRESAIKTLGPTVTNVLIADIVRQDV